MEKIRKGNGYVRTITLIFLPEDFIETLQQKINSNHMEVDIFLVRNAYWVLSHSLMRDTGPVYDVDQSYSIVYEFSCKILLTINQL